MHCSKFGLDLPDDGRLISMEESDLKGFHFIRGPKGYVDSDYTIGKTNFFRDENILLLADHAGEHGGGRQVTILQVGCSTGRETYSLALSLEEASVDYGIIALDTDPSRVEFAARGLYFSPLHSSPHHWPDRLESLINKQRSSLTEGAPDMFVLDMDEQYQGYLLISPHIRQRIRFATADIRAADVLDPIDYVVCNNLLEHYKFDPSQRLGMLRALANLLLPHSLLFTENDKANIPRLEEHYKDMHDEHLLGEADLREVSVVPGAVCYERIS